MARTESWLTVHVDLEQYRPEFEELACLYGGGAGLPARVVERVRRLTGGESRAVECDIRSDAGRLVLDVELSTEFLVALAELRALRAC